MLRLLVQQGKDIALIVWNEAETGTEQRFPTQSQKEVGKNQCAKHLEGRNASGWITILVSPWMVFKGYLVMEPPGLFLWRVLTVCNPPPNVGPIIRVCTSITGTPPIGGRVVRAGLDLGVVEQLEEKLRKGSYELAGLPWSSRRGFPCPKWLKKRTTEGPSCRCPI